MKAFGPTLEFFCKRQGVTLKDLANHLGISRNTITNWKANGRPSSREDAKKLAELLYLDEEETDALLISAQYAPEYSQSDTRELYSVAKSSISPNALENVVPFMVENIPTNYIQRSEEFNALIDKLLNEERESNRIVGIVAALLGADGYGKTTIAKALCHDPRIKEAFRDGILWITLGQNPSNLVGKVEDLIYILNRERPGFVSIEAASAYLAGLMANRAILLVIDDVWDEIHLKPFLQKNKFSSCLITTRNDRVLPTDTYRIRIDAMTHREAFELLSFGMTVPIQWKMALRKLSTRLGEWPLLLKSINSVMHARINWGETLSETLLYIDTALNKRKMTFFDSQSTQSREMAVSVTLTLSLDLLSASNHERYKELAIFPEDTDIPLTTIQKLWGQTGKLDNIDTEELCKLLYELSLLLEIDLTNRTVRLHDVMCTYLQQEAEEKLADFHASLLEAYNLQNWKDIPLEEPYIWEHLVEHLIGANFLEDLAIVLKNSYYLSAKVYTCTIYDLEADMAIAEEVLPDDQVIKSLRRNIARMSHRGNIFKTLDEVAHFLHNGLSHLSDLSEICTSLEYYIPKPFLTTWHPPLEVAHEALIRTFEVGYDEVWGCAISPEGDYIVSASAGGELKIWDIQTGALLSSIKGHTKGILACSVSPTGDFIVSASEDKTLKIWDAQTGAERMALEGHNDLVFGCAISPLEDFIVSASGDRTLKVWDAQTGIERMTLEGHTDKIWGCTISPAGDFIVSASNDKTLKIWDAQTGAERMTLRGHTGAVEGCAVNPTGDFIISCSEDTTLKIWNIDTGNVLLTLKGHSEGVTGCAISPTGNLAASASFDHTLKIWNLQTGKELSSLEGHLEFVNTCLFGPTGDFVVSSSNDGTVKIWQVSNLKSVDSINMYMNDIWGCAISPAGDFIVSASSDKTLKVWDAQTRVERHTLIGHTAEVTDCTINPTGDFIVSSSHDRTLKVWNAQTGMEVLTLIGHTKAVIDCAVSPNGDFIVSASGDGTLKVWDAQHGTERLALKGHTDSVIGCTVSPNGDFIVSASEDRTLKIWDSHSGKEILTLEGHAGPVLDCTVSPNGDFIVSASEDRTLKIWDSHSGKEILTLEGHEDHIQACAISQNGDFIISVSQDGMLIIWDASDGEILAAFDAEYNELMSCAISSNRNYIVIGGGAGSMSSVV